jgi:membrane protein YqaA with SNARE-associated domain
MTRDKWIHYAKLTAILLVVIVLSFVIAYFFNRIVDRLNLPIYQYAWLAYTVVFVVTLVANLTVLAPVPIAVIVMTVVAKEWNPALAALAAAAGGTIGELSGYYAGYAGRKIAIPNDLIGFDRDEKWIGHYGAWAIVFLAFQPLIPFDVGGIIAGAAKMPMRKFLPALFAGKLPKYLLLAYAAVGLIQFLPKSWFS